MNAILDFYGILGFFAIGQLLILMLYLFIHTAGSLQLKISFLLILGVIGFVLIHDTLAHTRLILYYPQLVFHGESFSLLIWPFIFFYIKIAFGKRVRWIDALHLIPFLLYQYSRLDLLLLPAAEKLQMLESYYRSLDLSQIESLRELSIWPLGLDFLYYRLQPLVYIIGILFFIASERKKRSGLSLQSAVGIQWIQLIFYGYLLIWLAKYIHYLGGFFYPFFNAAHPFQIVFLSLQVVLLSLLLLKSSNPPSRVMYKKEPEGLITLFEQIRQLFAVEKIFLEPQLNIGLVAERLGTNSKYVSLVSNEYFQKSFSELVNFYRIEEAKTLLKDPNNQQFTIEAIAQKAGFRSVATFNRAFKKSEQMTPTEFLKLINS